MKPKQRSDVHPNPMLILGFIIGPIPMAIITHTHLRDITAGLAGSAICIGGYLGWLYGRERYERWRIARHTYRPDDRKSPPPDVS